MELNIYSNSTADTDNSGQMESNLPKPSIVESPKMEIKDGKLMFNNLLYTSEITNAPQGQLQAMNPYANFNSRNNTYLQQGQDDVFSVTTPDAVIMQNRTTFNKNNLPETFNGYHDYENNILYRTD
jgi:hypothetical protein